MVIACNYLYMTDNLLDPTHVAWVHQLSYGNAACAEELLHTKITEMGVTISRWMRDVEVAPFYAKLVKFSGHCNRKQHYEVHYAGQAITKALFTPAGTGCDEGELHEQVLLMYRWEDLLKLKQITVLWITFERLRN